MKKTLLMVAAVATALLMSSCKEKEENRVLSAPEHQEKIENAINSFVAANPVEGFETFAREIYSLDTTYFYSYKLDALVERLYEILDVNEAVRDPQNHTETTTIFVALSNISGTFDFGKDSVSYTPTTDGTFLNLSLGEDKYNLSLRQEGNLRTALLMKYRGATDIYWEEEGKGMTSQGQYIVKLEVPERLVIDLTKNGALYGNITLTPSVNISEGGLDVRKDRVSFTATVTLGSYSLTVNTVDVDLQAEKLYGNATIANAGQEVLNLEVAADVAVRHNVRPEGPDSDVVTDIYLPSKLSNLKVNLRLMNQVELRGECDNLIQAVSPFIDYFENGVGVPADEPIMLDEWKRKIEVLNSLFRVNLYFTGNVASQAHFVLEPYFDYEPYSFGPDQHFQGDYCVNPLIVYPDGTRFSPVEYAAGLNVVELVMYYLDFVDMLNLIGFVNN